MLFKLSGMYISHIKFVIIIESIVDKMEYSCGDIWMAKGKMPKPYNKHKQQSSYE